MKKILVLFLILMLTFTAVPGVAAEEASLPKAEALGDLDGSGSCTLADVISLLQYLVGYPITFSCSADLSENGKVTVYDAILMLRMVNCTHSCEETVLTPAATFTEGLKKLKCRNCCYHAESTIPATKTLRVLAIGNSFSDDAMEQYLWEICEAGGVETLVLANLYIAGCSLDTHWLNIQNQTAAYLYRKNTTGSFVDTKYKTLQYGLADEDWDFITIQQSSGSSGLPDSYGNLANIAQYVQKNKTNPYAKVYWHMTWAYPSTSCHSSFASYNKDQMTMYNAIVNAAQEKALSCAEITSVVPTGTAIQNLRSSYLGDTLNRDGLHLSWDYGRYTAALTWYAALTGGSVDQITWVPEQYSYLQKDLPAIREVVKNAVKTPYAVTASTYTTAPA